MVADLQALVAVYSGTRGTRRSSDVVPTVGRVPFTVALTFNRPAHIVVVPALRPVRDAHARLPDRQRAQVESADAPSGLAAGVDRHLAESAQPALSVAVTESEAHQRTVGHGLAHRARHRYRRHGAAGLRRFPPALFPAARQKVLVREFLLHGVRLVDHVELQLPEPPVTVVDDGQVL